MLAKKIHSVLERYEALSVQLTDSDVLANPKKIAELGRQRRSLDPVVAKGTEYLRLQSRLEEDEAILRGSDDDLKAIVREELEELRKELASLEREVKLLLVPKDPRDEKGTVIEVRAGTGGEEAALFAADLYRMYSRYAERNKWIVETLSCSQAGAGGVKEVIFAVGGAGVFGKMKFEGGVHRVQRVPATEASGRIHTSAATVAILPEADEIDVKIDPADLRIDTFRAGGAGGQHVNKTESAVRILHLPTQIVVTCQDEKSQHKNRAAAMKVLRARLLAHEEEKREKARTEIRRSMVSTGDRSAKIRTYNFPQGRVTDHRIELTLYRLHDVLDGDLAELIDQLQLADQLERLGTE